MQFKKFATICVCVSALLKYELKLIVLRLPMPYLLFFIIKILRANHNNY